ncbi:MAG: aminoacyl-tRNA hydrolase [Hyphomicrobiaceae bacterium]|nr:aminoacyl-tRNA hydrolase [Hyphomicrobiaceae bacterium]
MKLFVGLGNPGSAYEGNRHNVGFMAVDAIAEAFRFGPWRRKFQGLVADGEIKGERVLLLKPQTYMNESGRSVGEAARFLKIPEAAVVVFYDEIDLAPGKLKVKTGGGNAGHNGLRSITSHLGNDYVRVRIGVGHPGEKHLVANFVLADFAKSERGWVDELLRAVASAAPRLVSDDQARFLSDVAKQLQTEGTSDAGSPPVLSRRATLAGNADDTQRAPDGGPRSAGGRHPSGERASKRQGALADNLKKWLAGRKPDDA